MITLSVRRAGNLTLLVLDRDGFVVRELVSGKAVQPGKLSFAWDGRDSEGRDSEGQVVPDEAYSFKIDLAGRDKTESYFPANAAAVEFSVQATYYDRQSGILSYKLPKACRVHIQAGTAKIDPKTKEARGPVLKTLVNRGPRVGGSVIEMWNSMDESGTVRVSDLPDFKIAIAATALPENSVITVGNRKERFLDRAAKRTGQSLLTFASEDHHHHRGLTALEDVSPALVLKPGNAAWSARERVWTPQEKTLKLSVSLEGPSADAFARQPGRLHVFLDSERVQTVASPKSGSEVEVSLASLSPGEHVVAVNWGSDYGPAAVNSLLVKTGESDGTAKTSKSREVGR